jgi:beta-galactosidase/beta-glucuronidase
VEPVLGIGYNAMTANLPAGQRAARYDRDFGAISRSGANTIVGWSEAEFDDVLMAKAAEYGLGVILPFQIGPNVINTGPNYAYEDPAVRKQLLDAVTRRVERYRNSPALRMWGLGNEVLHSIAWARGGDARSHAFADFLIETADRVHALDPNHPVVYRDAEDWYAPWIVQALARHPASRPWFVYGMNFFTMRMNQALDSGPAAGLNQPLMISEFGPVGLRPDARPSGYRQLWDVIARHRPEVLGGCAYVWTTAGPEPLDHNFGLTNPDGTPVDGSFQELSSLFQLTRSGTPADPSTSG